MSALAVPLVTAVATAALAVAGTYFTTRRNLEAQFDSSLRDLRIGAYKKLWQELQALAKYDRQNTLTRDEAHELAARLRVWYFRTGGLFLSHGTRQDYFALLDALETFRLGQSDALAEDDDEFVRVLGSRLRTGMTADVGTRRTFPFDDDERVTEPERRTFEDKPRERQIIVSRGPRRFRLFGRHSLALTGTDAARPPRWDGTRRSFTARIPGEGTGEERLYFLEGDEVVEGPKGWVRWDKRTRRPSAVWHERQPDA
jgi:hypothetical protein